jgi:diacylglycerol kinase (ATP)
MAIPILINPAANSAKASGQLERIRQLSPAAEVLLTEGVGSATRMALELAGRGHRLVVAAGGDGTVNEVINGLAVFNARQPDLARQVRLGILPVGTMNVMALELGLPGRDLEACWKSIQAGQVREVDLWKANEQYFAQLAGVGLDAEIVQQTPWKMKRRFGPLSYVMTAARVLGQEAPLLSVEIEDRPALYGSIVLVGNGRHYGGPVPVFRQASNTDGLLDIVIFRKRRLLEVFQFLSALAFDDGYQTCNDLDYVQARKFRVVSEQQRPVPYELDGELGKTTPVTFAPAGFPLQVVG